MLAAARGVLREHDVRAHLVEADAAALPLAERSVDVVTSRGPTFKEVTSPLAAAR